MVVAAGLPAQLGPERNCGSVRVTSRSVVVPSNCNLPLTTTLPAASVPTPMSPPQPPNLSAGHLLPDPEQIRQRELECMESLDVQLDELKQTLSWRLKQRSDCLYKEADKQKAELCMQVDQRVKEQALQLSREHNDQLLLLQQSKAKKRGRQTAQQQKLALKQRSTQLLLDYHHQQAEEELHREQASLRTLAGEEQRECRAQIQKLQSEQAELAQQLLEQRSQLEQLGSSSALMASQVYRVPSHTPLPASALYGPSASSAQLGLSTVYGAPASLPSPLNLFRYSSGPAVCFADGRKSSKTTQPVAEAPTVRL
mmetsp:Transcript_31688/g.105045  ORF Transcript_31688/g.105045 Transcript_31688/m.105045 type:complete len:312 (-) Transcript_31688:205-1140(-)